jgi:hypothetical protein
MLINDEIRIRSNTEIFDKDILQKDEIRLDESVPEEDSYKYIQNVNGDIIRRNNIDLNLSPDGLPLIELQLKKIEEADKELFEKYEKEKTVESENFIKLRCVILNKIGLNILTDTRFLKNNVKKNFINERNKYIEDLTQSKLDDDFNSICSETIFDCGEDVSKYPVFL